MIISTLSQVSHSVIHIAFIHAFSDYQVPVKTTLQEMMIGNSQRGIDYGASFGAFADNGELVGFILCGVREDEGRVMYYDGGSAVLPSWRGEGIGGLLLDRALGDANSRGAHEFVLEVLQDNLKAKKLYESRGFSISRNLRCFQKQIESIRLKESFNYEMYAPTANDFLKLAQSLPLIYEPSWQNSYSAITTIYNHLTTRVLTQDEIPVGYFVLNPTSGQILQIAAKAQSPAIYRELLYHAKSYTQTDLLKFINIDQSSPFITFLEEDGWTFIVDQYEMVKDLKMKQDSENSTGHPFYG